MLIFRHGKIRNILKQHGTIFGVNTLSQIQDRAYIMQYYINITGNNNLCKFNNFWGYTKRKSEKTTEELAFSAKMWYTYKRLGQKIEVDEMAKRIMTAVLCMVLTIAAAAVPCSVFGMEFSDVPITASYYKAVDKLSNAGVIQGRGGGVFGPADNTTRAEFCAFVARANNFNEAYYKTAATPFADVASGNWAESYISFCYQNGYVNGMGDGVFSPDSNVTCEQAVKIVVCASGVGDESLSKVGPKWYSGYINVARKNNLLDGADLQISEPANRAFVAQLVYNSMIVKGEDKADSNASHAVDVGSTSNGRLTSDGKNVASVTYEPEEVWEPSADDPEWKYYQYYGEEYKKYMESDEKNAGYTVPEENGSASTYVPRGSSDGMLVVIDPGHNYSGVDTGATGNGLREQDITYYIAEKLKPILEANGFEVVMTRNSLKENVSTESVSASLTRRSDIANRLSADLFVSIHCNAGGGTGSETYYCTGSDTSKVFADYVQKGIIDSVGLKNRGVKSARYAVLRNTNMPAVLVETGFIDTLYDAEHLKNPTYQQAYAEGIAKGICDFVGIEYK